MIGNRVKKARELANMTQEELANKIGITHQAIQRLEAGKTKQPRKMELIAKVLNVKPEWLLTGKQEYNADYMAEPCAMYGLTLEQKELLLIMQGLTKEQQKALKESAEKTALENKKIMDELLANQKHA